MWIAARWTRAVVVALSIVVPMLGFAQLAPELQRGLDWLKSLVSSATVRGEASAVANVVQVRGEAAETLRALASLPAPLAAAVYAHDADAAEVDTETVARRVIAGVSTGADVQPLLSSLLARQSSEGGFGGGPAHASHALDTAWAILALARAGRVAADETVRARDWLARQVQTQGALAGAIVEGPGVHPWTPLMRLYVSAMSSLALQTGSELSSGQAVKLLSAWLASMQGPDGGWAADSLVTAWVLQALTPVTSDAGLKSAASSFLRSKQAADGSWGADPFITALALRALAAQSGSGVSGGQSAIQGALVDAVSGLPVAGASVSAEAGVGAGTSPGPTVSDAQGQFSFTSLAAGSYTLKVSRAGYQPLTLSVGLAASQTAALGLLKLQPLTTSAMVRGTVTAQATGLALAGASVRVTSGATTLQATTDSSGRFEFSAVAPGALTLQASLTGYQNASASASVAGGQTLLFSPALVRQGDVTPGTGVLVGQIVNAAGGAPLPGAAVTVVPAAGGAAQVGSAGPDGRFSMTLAPAAYIARYSMVGFGSAEQRFALTGGSMVNAGVIALSAVSSSSTLTGRVLDTSGRAIAGATVELVNASPALRTLSAGDGSFRLAGIAALPAAVRAAASGFNSQTATLDAAQPSEFSFTFRLTGQATGSLALDALSVSPPQVGAGAQVRGASAIVNSSATNSQSITADFRIIDAAGGVVATGPALTDAGLPLGEVAIQPGQRLPIGLLWNSQQFAPGQYQMVLRLVEPGSKSIDRPAGSVVAERPAPFSIQANSHLSGSAAAMPPVSRAGTATPVALTAMVRNDGNQSIAAASYHGKVVDTKTGQTVFTATAGGAAMPVSALAALSFGNWVPAAGGDFEFTVSAVDPAVQGSVSTKIYVGDAGAASFTADKTAVPTGDQKVRATINVTGQDMANGTVSDPLAPLVRQAITKAVAFADQYANQHYMNDFGCYACHVQTQALVGGESNWRFVKPALPRQRATLLNSIPNQMNEAGAVVHGSPNLVSTSLALWAATRWHDDQALHFLRLRLADYIQGRQDSNGGWTSDHPYVWWNNSAALTGLNLSSLVLLDRQLATAGGTWPAPPRAIPHVVPGLNFGDGRLSSGADGSLYVANSAAGLLSRVAPSGEVQVVVSGLGVYGARPLAGGALVLATQEGVYLRDAAGSMSRLYSQPAWDAMPYGDGFLVCPPWGREILFVKTNGEQRVVFSSDRLAASGGVMAALPDGSVVQLVYNANRILRFSPITGELLEEVVAKTGRGPIGILPYAGGHLVGTEDGLYFYDSQWNAERWTFERAYGLAQMPNGDLLAGLAGQLRRIERPVTDVPAERARLAAAIDRAARALQTPAIPIDGNSNIEVAFRLIGLGAARTYYQGTTRAAAIDSLMSSVAAQLRGRQLADGGWALSPGDASSDSMVTAIAGVALDTMNPSPASPEVRRAVELLLARQAADGTWVSQMGPNHTPLMATTWVEIWLPTMLDRLGGIDTRLTLDLPANTVASNFTLPPTLANLAPDGGQHLEWKLDGVTSAGRALEFDVQLAGLAPGEQRPLASLAKLTFNNTFTNQPVDLPITIPAVKASAQLSLALSLDRASYPPDTAVLIESKVTNGAAVPAQGSVALSVHAPDGTQITALSPLATGSIAAGATTAVQGLWNTGLQAAASGYQIRATLFDAQNRPVTTAQAPFAITARPTPTVGATLASDKASYKPTDSVVLTERISNLQANVSLQSLSARTTLRTPSGALLWSRNEPIAQLSAGLLREFVYTVSLQSAAAGRYSALLEVLDSGGLVQAQASKTFDVTDTAVTGDGLKGTLVATPRTSPAGQAVVLETTVTNAGNSAFPALPTWVRLLDANAAVVAELPTRNVALAVGQTVNQAQSWTPPTALVGKTLAAVSMARVGTQLLILAQDRVQITPPLVQLSAAAQASREARVLALVSCPPGSDGGNSGAPVAGGEATCAAQRALALSATLDALGIVNKVVTHHSEFESGLRCGLYNTYWISGGSQKLTDDLVREVAEAVRRGDGLVIDGEHDARNALVHPAAGVKIRGKLSQIDQTITFPGTAEFPAGTLATLGRPTHFDRLTARAHAGFAQDATVGAVMSNRWGQGSVALHAYELVRMLAAPGGGTAQPAHLELVRRTLDLATPQTTAAGVGAPRGVQLTVRNTGTQKAYVRVTTTIPATLELLGQSPTATGPDAQGVYTWPLTLDAGQQQAIVLRLSNRQEGSATVTFDVSAAASATDTLLPQGSFGVAVASSSPATLGAAALQSVQALVPPAQADVNAKARAVAAIGQAQSAVLSRQFQTALAQWLVATKELASITSVDTSAAALAVAQALGAVERALCAEMACLAGGVEVQVGGVKAAVVKLNTAAALVRTVTNACSAALPSWSITAELTHRRTAQSMLKLQDDLTLTAGQRATRQGTWTAAGTIGDTLEAVLWGERAGIQWFLGRSAVALVAGPSLKCDADGNGVVNSLDIDLVRSAIGKKVSAGDPRDPTGDGVVTINDTRACTALCTKPNCAL